MPACGRRRNEPGSWRGQRQTWPWGQQRLRTSWEAWRQMDGWCGCTRGTCSTVIERRDWRLRAMKIERSRDGGKRQLVGRVGGRWGLFIYGAGAAPQSVGPELCAASGRAAGPLSALQQCTSSLQAARAPVDPPLTGQWPDPRRHRHPHLQRWPLFGRDPGGTPALLLRGRLLAQVPVQAQGGRRPSSPRPGSDPAQAKS